MHQNTMHKVADAIADAVRIPLLHLADVTAAAIRGAGTRRPALLGTRFTMEQGFYRDRIAAHGLDVLVPGPRDRDLVHRVTTTSSSSVWCARSPATPTAP